MEVKIGIQNIARELVIETDASTEEVTAAVEAARETGMVQLRESKGGLVIVPIAALGYLQLGEPHRSRVGFGA